MKTIAIGLVILFGMSINASSQNRIKGWNIEKITSIQVETNNDNAQKTLKVFNKENEINAVISFLIDVDFIELNDARKKEGLKDKEWNYKIVFVGQRDQIYLFEDYAFIGKTTFLIEETVINDFGILLNGF